MKQHIFIDFDRTLFNTELFQQLSWQAIGEVYDVDVAAARADMPRWYHDVGELHYYSMDEQLIHLFPDISPDDIIASIRTKLRDVNFVYPDSSEALAWQKAGHEVHIITFGEQWYQTTKRSFVPSLAGLPFHITLEPKSHYIAEHFPGARGVMIDDKRNRKLPFDVREVWLNRGGRVDNDDKGGKITINSLTQVEELL